MVSQNIEESCSEMSLIRPPTVRSAITTLNRSLFSKTVPIAAVRITNPKQIAKWKTALAKTDALQLDRLQNVRTDPDVAFASKGGKCIMLKPGIKADDATTWSPILKEAIEAKEVGIIPYDLVLDYDYWNYLEIMKSILPEDAQDEIPQGFAVVGHVAHLNIKPQYLPYKKVIAEVVMDKNPQIRTVINKIDDVGAHDVFRTFSYEVLAGPDDMNVEIHEGDCVFKFDYSKVYWNSRLEFEHRRLINTFEPGEVVCDVMAGIGPFAVPAGKHGVHVWANDLNPQSYNAMKEAITRNKVGLFVRAFNEDGTIFIRHAVDDLLDLHRQGKANISVPKKGPKTPRHMRDARPLSPIRQTLPRTISHFVMNLPATAIEFLGAYNGLYEGHELLFEPHTETKMPMVHVHCFETKSDDNVEEGKRICERITKYLGHGVKPGDGEKEGEVTIYEVRDVAPNKRMFCAEFRIPKAVAFGKRM